MNSTKHGLRSRKQALHRDDSFAYEERLLKWTGLVDADDDMGEFLVHQVVHLSVEIDRITQAQHDHFTRLVDSHDDDEFDAVCDLGNRLFFDRAGPVPLYGTQPENPTKLKTSWSGQAIDPDEPRKLVRQLESTLPGCVWLREHWVDLRDQLEPGKFWQSSDRLKAIRLLGCQPIDALDDEFIGDVFIASSALEPGEHKLLEDLRSDMDPTQHERACEQFKARRGNTLNLGDQAQCRQMLVDLVDATIERLNDLVAEYEQQADETARQALARLRQDDSPASQRMRQYRLKCVGSMQRAIFTFWNYQNKRQASRASSRGDDQRPGAGEDYWMSKIGTPAHGHTRTASSAVEPPQDDQRPWLDPSAVARREARELQRRAEAIVDWNEHESRRLAGAAGWKEEEGPRAGDPIQRARETGRSYRDPDDFVPTSDLSDARRPAHPGDWPAPRRPASESHTNEAGRESERNTGKRANEANDPRHPIESQSASRGHVTSNTSLRSALDNRPQHPATPPEEPRRLERTPHGAVPSARTTAEREGPHPSRWP